MGEDAIFAGDNFVRSTGEVRDINALTSFVMNANEKGNDDIHAQALPSQAQMMFEQVSGWEVVTCHALGMSSHMFS